jgi:molybdopterin synthase catalytic subunit
MSKSQESMAPPASKASPVGTHVVLSPDPLDARQISAALKSPEAGAVCVFEGIVRRTNRDREVLRLNYEAYEPMAIEVIGAIAAEARARFDILAVAAYHRTGVLELGETAVVIAVAAAHRDAAFQACRYLIDELKARAPIWKQEFYRDGAAWLSHTP